MIEVIDYKRLPKHIRGGAKRYIEDGISPGSFLSAVICNNLTESFARADETNISKMFDIVRFFYNEAPSQCWGSPKEMEDWVEKGGLHGSHTTETVGKTN